MLKTKKMPKKKQNKKPAKNDGKITKKKYIKTKIIGGKMIQLLTLEEKLKYLKECLVQNAMTLGDHFKFFKIIDSVYENDNSYFDYSIPVVSEKNISDFDNCLKYILLCLSDHDDYNSYALLTKLKKIPEQPELSETVDISEDKNSELLTKSELYFNKYKNFLEDFINKVVNSDTGSDVDTIASIAFSTGPQFADVDTRASRASLPETGESDEARNILNTRASLPETGESDEASDSFNTRASRASLPESGESDEASDSFNTRASRASRAFTSPQYAGAQGQQAESEENFFETSMFQIYTDGIVLLTIGDNNRTNHTLKVFKGINKKKDTEISGKDAIIDFFNTKEDILIIRRYYYDSNNEDYYWDCRIQLMYKLVNILIENIDKYKIAIETQLQTNLKDKRFLLKYKTNLLDKLIAIIFEKFKANKTESDNEKKRLEEQYKHQLMFEKASGGGSGPGEYTTGSVLRHGIILKSLKIIAYNNKIQYSDIEGKYKEKFKDFLPDIDLDQIVAASKKDIPSFGITNRPNCPNRKEFFEHIINVIYDHDLDPKLDTEKLNNRERNIDTLTKLSTSYDPIGGGGWVDKDCKTTIEKIIAEKGYLISEASIQSSELKEKYKLEDKTINNEIEINEELKKYNILINEYIYKEDRDQGLYYHVKCKPTMTAILKIYDEFKTHFNNKINKFSYKDIHILKDIKATVKVIIP
jgi:hypothetical protein